MTTLGLSKKDEKAALEGVMPWLAPTTPLATEALAKLDRPLLAWSNGDEFDSQLYYADYRDEPGAMSRLERQIAKLPPRPEWRMERVWLPDSESSPKEDAQYAAGCVQIGGHMLHPRCLDAYTTIAYEKAALVQDDGEIDDEGPEFAGDEDRSCVGPRRHLRAPAVPALPLPRRPALRGHRQPGRAPPPVRLRGPARAQAPA